MLLSQEDAAIKAAREKHGVVIDRSLFDLLVEKIRKNYPKWAFVDARRYALNECHIWEKKKRMAYNSALGMYFGQHGGYRASKGTPPRVTKEKKVLFAIEKSGQYRFVI